MRKLKNSELCRKSVEEFKKSDKTPFTIVLDNVRSLNNIGSAFRTSDAFMIEQIILCGITATPPHNEIRKTALGATDSVNWKYFKNTADAISYLKNDNYIIISIEQTENAVFLQDVSLDNNSKYALVFGNEVKGVQQNIVEMSDFCIEIPQEGTKHSLNVSVSIGIVIWDLFKKYKFQQK